MLHDFFYIFVNVKKIATKIKFNHFEKIPKEINDTHKYDSVTDNFKIYFG